MRVDLCAEAGTLLPNQLLAVTVRIALVCLFPYMKNLCGGWARAVLGWSAVLLCVMPLQDDDLLVYLQMG